MASCSLFKMLSKSYIQSTIVHKIYKTLNLNTVVIRHGKTKYYTAFHKLNIHSYNYTTNG